MPSKEHIGRTKSRKIEGAAAGEDRADWRDENTATGVCSGREGDGAIMDLHRPGGRVALMQSTAAMGLRIPKFM